MALMDLFRPKWKHSNWDVRKGAVTELADETLLARIAKSDKHAAVRKAAVGRVEDQALLGEIATNDEDRGVRMAAIARMEDHGVLAEVVDTACAEETDLARAKLRPEWLLVYSDVSGPVIEPLQDQPETVQRTCAICGREARLIVANVTGEIHLRGSFSLPDSRLAADCQGHGTVHFACAEPNQLPGGTFFRCPKHTPRGELKASLEISEKQKDVSAIKDPGLLASLAKADEAWFVRQAAVLQLVDDTLLSEIAANDPHQQVREAAEERLAEYRRDSAMLGKFEVHPLPVGSSSGVTPEVHFPGQVTFGLTRSVLDPSVLYVAADGPYSSSDGGRSWKRLPNAEGFGIRGARCLANGQVLFLTTEGPFLFDPKTDRWEQCGAGPPFLDESRYWPVSVDIPLDSAGRVFVRAGEDVYVSQNHGATFKKKVHLGGRPLVIGEDRFLVDCSNEKRIYSIGHYYHPNRPHVLILDTADGTSCEVCLEGVADRSADCSSIVQQPSPPHDILVTHGERVYRSQNRGSTWEPMVQFDHHLKFLLWPEGGQQRPLAVYTCYKESLQVCRLDIETGIPEAVFATEDVGVNGAVVIPGGVVIAASSGLFVLRERSAV